MFQASLQYTIDITFSWNILFADMVELADTQDLGSCASRHVGSTPTIRTMIPLQL